MRRGASVSRYQPTTVCLQVAFRLRPHPRPCLGCTVIEFCWVDRVFGDCLRVTGLLGHSKRAQGTRTAILELRVLTWSQDARQLFPR